MTHFENCKIIDISPLVSEKLAVFPGDVPYTRDISVSFEKGGNLLLSSIRATLHLGAHADASNHYNANGEGVEKRNLQTYLGACQVIHVKLPRGERILPKHIKHAKISTPRVLFHTGSFPRPNLWNDDFNSLSPELIEFLAAKNVKLVGIDTPSVDPADSKALESHAAIYKAGMCILEGIVLTKAPEGTYTLVALPLRLQGADASPVRAVLLSQ